jgi:hypothetical protein
LDSSPTTGPVQVAPPSSVLKTASVPGREASRQNVANPTSALANVSWSGPPSAGGAIVAVAQVRPPSWVVTIVSNGSGPTNEAVRSSMNRVNPPGPA